VGGVVLVGWELRIGVLTSISPDWVSMKASAALGFVLTGTSLWMAGARTGTRADWWRRVAQSCAALAAVIGLLTLVEYVAGWDLHIDQLLARDAPRAVGTTHPGRMAPQSAVSFLLAGLALVVRPVPKPWSGALAGALALPVALVSLLALAGYLYGVPALGSFLSHSGMALHTALAFLALSAGILAVRGEDGLLGVLLRPGPGGLVARRLLPVVLVVPPLLGWLRLQGQRAGFWGTEYGLALFALANVTVFAVLVWWSASSLDRLETERARAQGELARSTALFQGLFDSAPDAVVATDQSGRIVLVNRQAETLFGYSREELVGARVEQLMAERFRERHEGHRAGYLAAPRPRAMGSGLELFAKRKGGGEFPVDIVLGPVGSGGSVLVLSIVRDITERKRAERELAEQAEALARSNAELEQFAYVASHDLQEPLRMVSSFTQLLAKRYRGKLDADADDFIGFAVDGANRMQALIEDLLSYSRVGTRGRPFAPVDCEAVLGRVLRVLQVTVDESGAEVTHGSLPTVLADESQLGQVFQNLIANAIRFRGEAPLLVHVSADRGDLEWTFSVRDNGIGVAPEHAQRIFVIFQRLHGRTDYPGTGIGLAVCKKIVERHGGRIWVDSELGRGATFKFTIPVQPDRASGVKT
jgi:PAS domain S-box-containing protein